MGLWRARRGRCAVRRSLRGHQRGRPCSPRGSPASSPTAVIAQRAIAERRGAERRADRTDPRLGDRRRRGARRPVRPAAPRVRRLHRVGPRAARSSRTSSATRCCRCTRTRTPSRRRPGCRRRALREDARRIIHRAVGGSDEDVVLFCGSGATGAIDKLVHVLGLRIPSALEDGSRSTRDPGRAAAGRLRRPVRAPLQRAAVARVDRRRRHDPRGRRRARRPRRTSRRSSRRYADRPLQDRQLLRRVERDRDHHRRRAGRDRCCTGTARCRCWDYAAAGPYLPIEMNPSPEVAGRPPGLQGRRLPLAAQVRRRPRHAGRARREARALRATACRRCPAAGRSSSSARRGHSYHPEPGDPRGGRHAGDRRVDPRRARRSRSRRRSAPTRSGGARTTSSAARSTRWGANPQIEILGNPDARAAGDRLARPPAPARPAALELRRRACSTTCSASRRAAAASAPAPTSTACTRSTTTWSRAHGRRGRARPPGREARVRPRSASTTSSSEAVFDYIVDAVHLVANEGWKLLPLYRFDPYTGLWHHASAPRPAAAVARTTSLRAGALAPARAPSPRARSPATSSEARADHRAARGAARRTRRARSRADAGVRAHPLVPAAGRGAAPPDAT